MHFLVGIILCGLVAGIECAATHSGILDYILNELTTLKHEVRENSELTKEREEDKTKITELTEQLRYKSEQFDNFRTEVRENSKLIRELTKEREEDKTKITELTEQLRYKSEQFDKFRTEFELLKDTCQLVGATYASNAIRTTKKPTSLSVQPTNNISSLIDDPVGQNRPDNTTMVTDGHAIDGNANNTTGDTSDAKQIHTSTRRGSKRLIADETPPLERIAFSVHSSGHVLDLSNDQVVPFDTVTANAGDAFDPVIHMFVCPVDGMYYFQSALLATYHHHIETEIVKAGVVLALMYAAGTVDDSSHGYDQGASAAVTACNEGEHVWVRQNSGTEIDLSMFTSFSGFLLFTL